MRPLHRPNRCSTFRKGCRLSNSRRHGKVFGILPERFMSTNRFRKYIRVVVENPDARLGSEDGGETWSRWCWNGTNGQRMRKRTCKSWYCSISLITGNVYAPIFSEQCPVTWRVTFVIVQHLLADVPCAVEFLIRTTTARFWWVLKCRRIRRSTPAILL